MLPEFIPDALHGLLRHLNLNNIITAVLFLLLAYKLKRLH